MIRGYFGLFSFFFLFWEFLTYINSSTLMMHVLMDLKEEKERKNIPRKRWSVIRFHPSWCLLPVLDRKSSFKSRLESLRNSGPSCSGLRKKNFFWPRPTVQTSGKTELYLGSMPMCSMQCGVRYHYRFHEHLTSTFSHGSKGSSTKCRHTNFPIF